MNQKISCAGFFLYFGPVWKKRGYLSWLLFLAFLPLLCACSESSEKSKNVAAAPVHTREVKRADVPRIIQAVGNVRASAQVSVTPRVTGQIVDVLFREGEEVKAGEPLIRIDERPYQATLAERKAQLARTQAQLAKAQDDRARFAKLVDGGFVSREAYEQAATDAAALRASLAADKAAVESAALDLAYCTLTAPISGRAGALKVDKGNLVKSGDATPIVSLETIAPCYVNFSVPESQLGLILESLRNGPVALTAKASNAEPEPGFLTLVDNSVDTRTGTIPLRASFANSERRLWPGAFVQVFLPLGVARDALVVPTRAVLAGRDEHYVYVAGADGLAKYRKVKVLFEADADKARGLPEKLSVVEGELEPGERVVVEGQVRLAPGLKLNILD